MTNELIQLYYTLEKEMSMFLSQESYSNLVRADENGSVPIQRWYHCREAFSVDLLEKLISDWKIPRDSIKRILDPFLGIGTTLLAAQRFQKKNPLIEAVGIEVNPFLHFVSTAKINWHRYDLDHFGRFTKKIIDSQELPNSKVPLLSTIKREDVFEKDVRKQILGYKALIYEYKDKPEFQILMLGLAGIIEQVSGIKKDGRALRIVESKKRPPVEDALQRAWSEIYKDLRVAKSLYNPVSSKVLQGDGRRLKGNDFFAKSLGKFDLILCSPPYLNNKDYSEIYKIELWMLDFIKNHNEFRGLRQQTFRSHPSIKFKEELHFRNDPNVSDFASYLNILKNSLPKDKYFDWRIRLFEEYFDDIYLSLRHQCEVLNPGGWAFWVIGNTSHGSAKNHDGVTVVASDLLTADLARRIGFTVKGIMVARNLRHRTHKLETNYFLRESIIALKRDKGK